MLALKLGEPGLRPTVLCLGAHCDDIEIGCGATLVRWRREYPGVRFVWAVFAGEPERVRESRAAAQSLLGGVEACEVRVFDFPDRYFPTQAERLKGVLEELKASVSADVVFTHQLHDRHQDHALIADLTWNAFRSHLILEYEIPKYEGDLGQPNVFVPLTAEDLQRKVDTLLQCFPSQRSRSWFTADTFRALARLRGIECASASGFAEAFHGRKVCL